MPLTFGEWHDSVCGRAGARGDQSMASTIMDFWVMLDSKTAMEIYKDYKCWPSEVPFEVMRTAISAFSIGRNHFFDIVFEKEDTHITVAGLKSLMESTEYDRPWLKWVHLVDWKALFKPNEKALINPKFLKSLYKYDPHTEKKFWDDRNMRGDK